MIEPPETPRKSRTLLVVVGSVGLLFVLPLVLTFTGRTANGFGIRWPWSERPATVTHAIVVSQIQDVSKLVSTELTLRDVVTYDQSWMGMKRKALYVVTGKVLAGIDLKKGTDVRINAAARTIQIELPRAEILAVDVLNTTTYDEQQGLLYRFTPEERDRIQRQVREKLKLAGEQSGLLPQADRSARQLLQTLLARDGFTVDVRTRTGLNIAPPRSN